MYQADAGEFGYVLLEQSEIGHVGFDRDYIRSRKLGGKPNYRTSYIRATIYNFRAYHFGPRRDRAGRKISSLRQTREIVLPVDEDLIVCPDVAPVIAKSDRSRGSRHWKADERPAEQFGKEDRGDDPSATQDRERTEIVDGQFQALIEAMFFEP